MPRSAVDAYAPNEDMPLVVAGRSGVLADDTDVDSATPDRCPRRRTDPRHATPPATGGFTLHAAPRTTTVRTAFTYRASDGSLQSGVTPVTLTVAAVNDPPTFMLGPDPTVAEDFASSRQLPGLPDRASARVRPTRPARRRPSLRSQVASPLLFLQQPAIDGAGTLTFRPAANRSGSSLVTVTVTDNGGIANGGDDSGSQTFLITVTGIERPADREQRLATDEPDDDGPRIEAGITTPLDVLANDFTSPDVGETLTIVGRHQARPRHGHHRRRRQPPELPLDDRLRRQRQLQVHDARTASSRDTATVFLTIADTLAADPRHARRPGSSPARS